MCDRSAKIPLIYPLGLYTGTRMGFASTERHSKKNQIKFWLRDSIHSAHKKEKA